MTAKGPVLIVFGGLPGVGKSSLAKAAASQLKAVYLRIDTIEQALRSSASTASDLGPVGYAIAYQLAQENLSMGGIVVADSVNPVHLTRDAWMRIAQETCARIMEIEVVCSDEAEHRRRVESRSSDIEGLSLPSWKAVRDRRYEHWSRPHIVFDTAGKSMQESMEELLRLLSSSECLAEASHFVLPIATEP